MMLSGLATVALAVVLAFFASNSSVVQAASQDTCLKQTIECPPFVTESLDYDIGRVIFLGSFGGRYEVQVLTIGQTFTISVPKDLWDQLDIGDTVIHYPDELRLLHKGPEPGKGAERK